MTSNEASETPTVDTQSGSRRVLCPQCQEPFRPDHRQRAALAGGREVYCSRVCQKAAGTVTRECSECGTSFTRSGGKATAFRGIRAFCSPECRAKQPKRPRTRKSYSCAHCGKSVERTPSQGDNKTVYCSRECKARGQTGVERVERPVRLCEVCETPMSMTPDMIAHDQRNCSRECANKARRRKPGERYIDSSGYAWITTPDGRSMMEHSYVMEQHLGRRLTSTETVHHKTGGFAGRSNNDLSNLEHWTGRHPKGHRVEDIVTYCREMLAVYGDDVERERYASYARAVLEGMVEG